MLIRSQFHREKFVSTSDDLGLQLARSLWQKDSSNCRLPVAEMTGCSRGREFVQLGGSLWTLLMTTSWLKVIAHEVTSRASYLAVLVKMNA